MVPSYLRSVYRMMYQNPVGRKLIKFPVTTSLLRRATARHGLKMDNPNSAAQIEKFIETYGVNLDEAELSLDCYPTFNDFFARKLKPGLRPIAGPNDNSILVAPADCRLLVFPSIEDTTKIWLKGQDFTISSLLGPNFQHLLSYFHNPAIAIARLAPQDYHRWHLPLSTTIGPRSSIDGTYFSVSPRAVREVNILCTNKREVCMFENELYGRWCMIAVGAAMVSSISIAPDMAEGHEKQKGDEHGWFRYGGSTLILLFDSHSVVWDEDLIQASRKPIETYVKVGTQIGRSRKAVIEQQTAAAAAAATPAKREKKGRIAVPSEVTEEETRNLLLSPSPVSPSLIHTATTDAARKEANLNDEGLVHDFPWSMQSNLTLVPLEEGDTVPARGISATTRARTDAAEAVGGDISNRRPSTLVSVADLLPAFLATPSTPPESGTSDLEAPSAVSSPPSLQREVSVPAPPVFQLVHFPSDEDEEEDEATTMDEDEEMGESTALITREADDNHQEQTADAIMQDVDVDSSRSSSKKKKQYSQSKFLAPPATSTTASTTPKSNRRRSRATTEEENKVAAAATSSNETSTNGSAASASSTKPDEEDVQPQPKKKKKGSRK